MYIYLLSIQKAVSPVRNGEKETTLDNFTEDDSESKERNLIFEIINLLYFSVSHCFFSLCLMLLYYERIIIFKGVTQDSLPPSRTTYRLAVSTIPSLFVDRFRLSLRFCHPEFDKESICDGSLNLFSSFFLLKNASSIVHW